MLLFSLSVGAQSIQITSMDATAVAGGINVNLKTISFNGAGYLSHSHTITGNTIDLSVCYYFNLTLPVLTFDDNFFIPVTEAGNYTVNVTVYNSASTEVCDFFSSGGTASDTVLSSDQFDKPQIALFPNPTNGIVTVSNDGSIENLTVYDQVGRLVIHKNSTNTIDLTDLSNGVYLVKGEIATQAFTQKIIKR